MTFNDKTGGFSCARGKNRGTRGELSETRGELRADDRTPAASFILDAYLLTKDERYLAAIQPHLAALERFDGERFDGVQPHYMLNNIAVRHWDDYWFEPIQSSGDTLPHYWSSLRSIDYIKYAGATGDDERLRRGVCGLRDCLRLFMRDGSASCAAAQKKVFIKYFV